MRRVDAWKGKVGDGLDRPHAVDRRQEGGDVEAMSPTERDQAKAVLKGCSSKDASAADRHYFEVSTGVELDAAFQEVIRNTEKVALTQ